MHGSLDTRAVWREAWAAQQANFTTHCHGIDHWVRVERNGLWLATQLPGVDVLVLRLFAALHDCQRLDDGGDRSHGARAADYTRHLDLPLTEDQLKQLLKAVNTHSFGPTVSDDLTVQVCHDADRLDLGRVGTKPKPGSLNTQPAQKLAGRDAIESLDEEEQDLTCPEHFVPTPRWDFVGRGRF